MIIMPPPWLTLEPLGLFRHSVRARLDRPGVPCLARYEMPAWRRGRVSQRKPAEPQEGEQPLRSLSSMAAPRTRLSYQRRLRLLPPTPMLTVHRAAASRPHPTAERFSPLNLATESIARESCLFLSSSPDFASMGARLSESEGPAVQRSAPKLKIGRTRGTSYSSQRSTMQCSAPHLTSEQIPSLPNCQAKRQSGSLPPTTLEVLVLCQSSQSASPARHMQIAITPSYQSSSDAFVLWFAGDAHTPPPSCTKKGAGLLACWHGSAGRGEARHKSEQGA